MSFTKCCNLRYIGENHNPVRNGVCYHCFSQLKTSKSEIIKPVNNYSSKYLISNYGRVFSLNYRRSGKVKEIKPYNKKEYLAVDLLFSGKRNTIKVHRLVASHFIPNLKSKPQVNHIDGNKKNNHFSNLEWATNSENQIHAFNSGLQSNRKGSKNNASKLDESDVLKIRKMLKETSLSQSEIAEHFNIKRKTVSDIKTGRTWAHV